MKGISGRYACELSIRKSRFLAEIFPVASQEEARALLKAQKEKYPDATHVVHAFVIGPTGGILGCSDDGEPSGTAGRPVLDVLKGSGVTGALLTVTRWFGGVLLGTGGLVKAYGESAKAVLGVAPAEEIVEKVSFSLAVSYEFHDRLGREMEGLNIEILDEEFAEGVTIRGRIAQSRFAEFSARVIDLTSGRSVPVLSEESPTGLRT
jgi:uncharacterized protein, YigZ family